MQLLFTISIFLIHINGDEEQPTTDLTVKIPFLCNNNCLKDFKIADLIHDIKVLFDYDESFNYFIFVQRWPQTECYKLQYYKNFFVKCYLGEANSWTVRGLWPSRYRTVVDDPELVYCNRNWKFDVGKLNEIKELLQIKWADVQNRHYPYEFWEKEWNKHGTCAENTQNDNGIKNYFQKALDFYEKYNMAVILNEATIFPGRSYLLYDYINAIRYNLGVVAQIHCIFNEYSYELYLYEIRLCLKKSGIPVSCSYFGNCPLETPILYPSLDQNDVNDISYEVE